MIKLAKYQGTCNSNTRGLNVVYDIYEREINKDNPKRIITYKTMLYNDKVQEEFNNLGIEEVADINLITKEDIVIISPRGISKEDMLYLKNNDIEFYDTTCPKLKKIYDLIYQKYLDNYNIIVIGDKNSEIVMNMASYTDNNCDIINSILDIENLNKAYNKIFITADISIDKEVYTNLVNTIKNRYSTLLVEECNSSCNEFIKLLDSAQNIAKSCDIIFIIGNIESKSTKEVYEQLYSHKEVYIFSDINKIWRFVFENDFKKDVNIALIGGLSTPIKELYNYKYLLSFLFFYKEKYLELKNNQELINNSLINDLDNNYVKKVLNDFIDLNQDGKYIRGALIALGYLIASENKDNKYLNLAYAYEMFQTSILIHDDIIDNARIRRGKETIPRRICHKYLDKKKDKSYQNDVIKLANSLGICAGDLGFYHSLKLINNYYQEYPNYHQIVSLFTKIVISTIKGEVIDVYLPFMGKYNYASLNKEDIIDIYHLKTSWYTIIGPLSLGYALGNKSISKDLENILNKIGLTFQIKDDLLGIFSDSNVIGKPNTSDIEEFKQTLLYYYVINTSYKDEFLKIYGKRNINNNDLNNIRDILIKSGSYDYVLNYLDNLYSECLNDIDNLELEEDYKDILKGLLIYINIREK